MSDQAIYDFNREGSWNSAYSSHYECAWLCLYDFEATLKALKEREISLENEARKVPPEYYTSFMMHHTDDLHTNAYRAATSAHLYVCMAIEGFINYYGVKRLGESFYKRVLERMGITEKLMLIYLLCFDHKLEAEGAIMKPIRRIFDQRNALVHPKTKEFSPDRLAQFIYKHPFDLKIHVAFETLERFADEMCSMDTHISREFHFKKPNKSMQPSAMAPAD